LKTYDAKDIRNVLLVGHGGSGKTTLLEAMLFTAGSITRMGAVEDGNTVSDHDPDEQRKGISVSLSMAPIEWEGVKINVLDAPGYADFIGDLRSAILAADAVIVVVSAVDGVEVQTEAAWELAVEAGLPRAIFVNKLDRERADFQATLAQLVSAFGNQVAPFELPIGAEHEFRGVADLLHEKADLYPSGPKAEESEWPEEIHRMADPAREKLIEAVAESDDDLIEEYLEVGTLPEEHIVSGAKDGFARARLAPVIVGSAAKAIGIDRLLDFIVEEFPSPIDRGPVVVQGKGGGETERSCDPNGPLCAFVFKTVSDPFVGHITMFRVIGGRVRPDSTLHNATQGTDERIGQLFTQKGKEHEPVPEVAAGDIGAVAKLQHAHTGDTFSGKDDPTQVPTIPLPEPLLARPQPERYPLTAFPEISMRLMDPWGATGANPMPEYCERLAAGLRGQIVGGWPYSEGIYEDFNKFYFARFFWNIDQTASDAAHQYAAYYFGPAVAEEGARLLAMLEKTQPRKDWQVNNLAEADEAFSICQGMEARMPTWATQSWRWRIVRLRAEIDHTLRHDGLKSDEGRTKLARCTDELTRIYHAERAETWVRPLRP
jgi:small GTP-binding protein